NRTTIELSAIERFDRGTCLVIVVHRDKGKTARPARVAVRDHGDFFHLTMGRKLGLQRFLGRGKGKVANIQLHRAKLQNTEPKQQGAGSGERGVRQTLPVLATLLSLFGSDKLPRSFWSPTRPPNPSGKE